MTMKMTAGKPTPDILIVDDKPHNLRLLCDMLRKENWKVRPVSSGMLALQAATTKPPDLILLDIMMPGMDGFQVCTKLKANPLTRHIPVIMVTALTDRESRLKGLEAGAADFLSKPVDQTEIIVRTRNLLLVKEYEEFLKNHNEHLERQVKERIAELEKAHIELRSAQARLLEQEKMATIGMLMAGIAHEINNPVGFITSNLGSLKKYGERLTEFISGQDEAIQAGGLAPLVGEQVISLRHKLKISRILRDLPELIEECAEGAERIKKIVQDLKCFSRTDTTDEALTDINQCLESALAIVHNELKYKATVRCEYGELSPTIGNAQKLGQVFINLLINAGHAIDEQGEITVRTQQENDWIFVEISDTGCGIPEDIRQRIFEPLFTTKEIGKGTGLGLAICQEIVNKHGGKLDLVSETGKGSTFTVSIPLVTK
jgi:signal transduction histidine kinase